MHRPGTSYARHADDLDGEVYDVVVIGSGIGGLTAAVLLAKHAGKRVLVLEQHYVAGGFTHSFARPGYDWDVGIHYLGAELLREGHPTKRLFDEVTGGEVAFEEMGEVYDRIVIGDDVYDYVTGLTAWKEQMGEYFPAERAGIDRYVELVKQVSATSRTYFASKALPSGTPTIASSRLRRDFLALSRRSTADVLAEVTDDTRLRAVLAGQYGDYGLPPKQSSFAIHAMVTNHYWRGAVYPVGGASTIPAAAERVLEAHGGRILVGAAVTEIMVRRGKAVGVRMADGREITASQVVSNAGAFVTVDLLPDEVRAEHGLDRQLGTVERSVSHLTLYLGLDATDEKLGLTRPNLWLYPSEDHDANIEAFVADPDAAPLPLVYASFPSAKDPDFANRHPGHSTIDVITLAKHEWFAQWDGTRWQRRGDEYEERKASFTERLLDTLEPWVPALRDHIDVAELSTPLTTSHFAGFAQGELYGIAHDPGRFDQAWLRPRTPVDGLWLTGADVVTAGVVGGLMGGALTAGAMAGPQILAKGLRSKLPF
ncbi:MAG: all-trans-retinol 13,14-reductase [Glaciecola sp.]|jgi:all-trans-retinol 13,14-reductase